MNPKKIEQLCYEADRYPLGLRLAAHLYQAGERFESFQRVKMPHVPTPLKLTVQNYLRDLERGQHEGDKLLLRLASQL